jgi:hypothetical protein
MWKQSFHVRINGIIVAAMTIIVTTRIAPKDPWNTMIGMYNRQRTQKSSAAPYGAAYIAYSGSYFNTLSSHLPIPSDRHTNAANPIIKDSMTTPFFKATLFY